MEFQPIGKKLQEEYSMHSIYKERDKKNEQQFTTKNRKKCKNIKR